MNSRWVSASHSGSRHGVTRGWGERSLHLRGLMEGKGGWNYRSQFSIKSPLKVSQGYMGDPAVLPKMKLLIHLSIKSSKKAHVSIEHDHDPSIVNHSSYQSLFITLRHVLSPHLWSLTACINFIFASMIHKNLADILGSTHLLPLCQNLRKADMLCMRNAL